MSQAEPESKWNTLRKELATELQEILNWWSVEMVDEANGGFYGRIDGHNVLHSDADKGIILNTRILWTFAAAGRISGERSHRLIADRAYHAVRKHFHDEEHGGLYWLLRPNGDVVSGKKQVYAQAFGIYAMTEYHRLTGDQDALAFALTLFELLEKYSRDLVHRGYLEAFDQNWAVLDDVRLSDHDQNALKTMNTHLHMLEAYTNLARLVRTDKVLDALRNLILLFVERFIDPVTFHMYLFFDEHWNSQSNTISYGHDIECSWLLFEAAEVLADDSLLERVANVAESMAIIALKEGFDDIGGMMYERFEDGRYDTEKHWWVQAEAAVGFVNAWQISGDRNYLDRAIQVWQFIQDNIKDYKHGEWAWSVDVNGEINTSEDKAGPWKAPYHNARMCMEILNRQPGI